MTSSSTTHSEGMNKSCGKCGTNGDDKLPPIVIDLINNPERIRNLLDVTGHLGLGLLFERLNKNDNRISELERDNVRLRAMIRDQGSRIDKASEVVGKIVEARTA